MVPKWAWSGHVIKFVILHPLIISATRNPIEHPNFAQTLRLELRLIAPLHLPQQSSFPPVLLFGLDKTVLRVLLHVLVDDGLEKLFCM